jgi:hypothetical protein
LIAVEIFDEVHRDLSELYFVRTKKKGHKKAQCYYVLDVLSSVRNIR